MYSGSHATENTTATSAMEPAPTQQPAENQPKEEHQA